jgi:hypothetical protein
MSHPFSTQVLDGLARPSVEGLIGELETGMQGRGANHMNITGMNLAIVRTIMNHVDRLQDRIESLEGQIHHGLPDATRDPARETPVKRTKTVPATPIEIDSEEDCYETEIVRYETLKSDLQKLYGGRAQEYDPTAGGHMFPPHGMCMSEITLKTIDNFQDQITKIEKEIARLEQELGKNTYTPISPHPMIVLEHGNSQNTDPIWTSGNFNPPNKTSRSIEARNQLVRDIAKQEGERRILQEGIDFWSTVKPASAEYMQKVQRMFFEKNQLRARLWEVHGLRPSAW